MHSPTWTATPPNPSAPQLVRFQLTANLAVGGSANAVPLRFAPSDKTDLTTVKTTDYQALTKPIIKVFDVRHRNYAPTGTRGYALWCSDSQRFEILDLWHKARWCIFQLTEDLVDGDAAATATVVRTWDGLPITGSITVKNDDGVGFTASDGDKGVATMDDDGNWVIVNVRCTAPE